MRLRFTIRDLLWLTALVAMGVAWLLNTKRIEEKHALETMHLELQLMNSNKALHDFVMRHDGAVPDEDAVSATLAPAK